MRTTTRLLALLCAIAFGAVACGSSSKGVTKDDYVKEALAVCAKTQAKLEAISHRVGATPTIDEVKDAYTDDFVPTLRSEVKQLRALDAPEKDQAKITHLLDDLSKGLDQGEAAIKNAKNLKALENAPTPAALASASKEAKAYGLGKCAGGS